MLRPILRVVLVLAPLSACTRGDTAGPDDSAQPTDACADAPTVTPIYACEIPSGYDGATLDTNYTVTSWMDEAEVVATGTGVPEDGCIDLDDWLDKVPAVYDPADAAWVRIQDESGLSHTVGWVMPGGGVQPFAIGDVVSTMYRQDWRRLDDGHWGWMDLSVQWDGGMLALWFSRQTRFNDHNNSSTVSLDDLEADAYRCDRGCGEEVWYPVKVTLGDESAELDAGQTTDLSTWRVAHGGTWEAGAGCDGEPGASWLAVAHLPRE